MSYGHSGGSLTPVIKRLNTTALRPGAILAGAAVATMAEAAGTVESPRDYRIGCQRIVVPFPVYLTGYEFAIQNITAAGWSTMAAAVNTRIWLWTNSDTTYLPTGLLSGSDTGARTLATCRTAASNDAETAINGRGRCINVLPSTILVPAGEYTLAFAMEKVYTAASASEPAPSLYCNQVAYQPFGGSATAALHRGYGYEVTGSPVATSLTNYSIPTSRALGDFSDANAWGEANVAVNLLCTGGI